MEFKKQCTLVEIDKFYEMFDFEIRPTLLTAKDICFFATSP